MVSVSKDRGMSTRWLTEAEREANYVQANEAKFPKRVSSEVAAQRLVASAQLSTTYALCAVVEELARIRAVLEEGS
jgi:hypothetical protein